MTCLKCKHHEAKRFGFYGHKRIQRFRCPGCKTTFSAPRLKPLGRHYIEVERAAQIVTLLLEGVSVRSVSRITGVHQGTILSLPLTVGEKCRNLFDSRVRNIHPRYVQADELWTFVHTKEGHLLGDVPLSGAIATCGWPLTRRRKWFCPTTRGSAWPRVSLGFSKTLEHLKTAVNLYMAFFNFCRVHQGLRVTPAMQTGIADHIWTVQELLEAA